MASCSLWKATRHKDWRWHAATYTTIFSGCTLERHTGNLCTKVAKKQDHCWRSCAHKTGVQLWNCTATPTCKLGTIDKWVMSRGHPKPNVGPVRYMIAPTTNRYSDLGAANHSPSYLRHYLTPATCIQKKARQRRHQRSSHQHGRNPFRQQTQGSATAQRVTCCSERAPRETERVEGSMWNGPKAGRGFDPKGLAGGARRNLEPYPPARA